MPVLWARDPRDRRPDCWVSYGGPCLVPSCKHAVELHHGTGRWYITMGHPGFNSYANNGHGYRTEAEARRVVAKYISGVCW